MADLSAEARSAKADVAQLAERVLGKDEVSSSILDIGSSLRSLREFRLGKPSCFAPERTAKADSYLSRRSAKAEDGSARPATGRAEAHSAKADRTRREGG
jgi:hypothetical protein